MQSFKTYITEADTSSATNAEDAIVYTWNRTWGKMSHEEALDKGKTKMTQKDYDKLDPDGVCPNGDCPEGVAIPPLLKTGRKVIADWPSGKGDNFGGALKVGSEKSGPNYYDDATDNTSKADFYGNEGKKGNNISLKKENDKKGAQLISSKSEEAAGCVNAAILHWEKNDKGDILKAEGYKRAIEILGTDMLNSARTDVAVPVSTGKKDLLDWYYSKECGRLQALTKNSTLKKIYKDKKAIKAFLQGRLKKGEKLPTTIPNFENLIKRHMKYELQKLNAVGADDKKTDWKKELPEIKPTKATKKTWVKDLTQPSVETLRTHIYPLYINSVTSVDTSKITNKKQLETLKGWDDKMMRTQITELIDVSVGAIGWKDELTTFFEGSDGLKKWVVYEAGSGLYKFTGKISDGKDYPGGNWRVANKMLVFNAGGYKKEYVDMIKWADDNAPLVNQMDISYKGSGMNRYIKFGIPTLLKKSVDEAIDYELPMLQEELQHIQEYYLAEGIFGDVWTKAKGIGKKVKDMGVAVLEKIKTAWKNFRIRVVKKIIEKIKKVALAGVMKLLEFLGFKIEATLKLGLVS